VPDSIKRMRDVMKSTSTVLFFFQGICNFVNQSMDLMDR